MGFSSKGLKGRTGRDGTCPPPSGSHHTPRLSHSSAPPAAAPSLLLALRSGVCDGGLAGGGPLDPPPNPWPREPTGVPPAAITPVLGDKGEEPVRE